MIITNIEKNSKIKANIEFDLKSFNTELDFFFTV